MTPSFSPGFADAFLQKSRRRIGHVQVDPAQPIAILAE
jgi:hypothetical protein